MTETDVDRVNGLLAAYDRPSAGTSCTRCGDWGTVVISRGRASQEEVCPVDDCAAADKARLLRVSK